MTVPFFPWRRRALSGWVGGLVWIMGALGVLAVGPGADGSLENYDHRLPAAGNINANNTRAAGLRANTSNPDAAHPELRIARDPVLGLAQWVTARRGLLTGPTNAAKGNAASLLPADPYRPVKKFLTDNSDVFGHGAEILQTARINREFTTEHNGLHSINWDQALDGISVFQTRLSANITRQGEMASIASSLIPDPEQAAVTGHRNYASGAAPLPVSAQSALVIAATEIGETLDSNAVSQAQGPEGAPQLQTFTAPGLAGIANARLVWLPVQRGEMRLCWNVILTGRRHRERYCILVDAETGRPWIRECRSFHLSPATYRVYTNVSPTPMSPGFSVPSTNQPPEVSRVLVTLTALDANASPAGWLPDGASLITAGNNVDAHLDQDADNTPDLPRIKSNAAREFDFPLNLAQTPANYSSASVVQLFYWCNWMHDQLYSLGFTEAAGNYQNNNFGRGGTGGDAIQADCQDGGDTDNAQFFTPQGDGATAGDEARMEMFIFSDRQPGRDGSLDAHIVLHEYTHGLTGRLIQIGTAPQSQSSGQAEGWSDFYALALTSKPEDGLGANYPMAPYATYQFGGLKQNYYFGIRRYPYSTNLSVSPLTYKDIDPSQAGSHPGVSRSPTAATNPAEVHNQGEVWCAILWEARANLIAKYGYSQGNRLILQLVTDGLKLSPDFPTFIQSRDAILLADLVDTGGANQKDLWLAFAKRGLGSFATAPPVATTIGVFENFSLPDDLRVTPAQGLSFTGPPGGPFQPFSSTFALGNSDVTPIPWAVGTDPLFHFSARSGTVPPGTNSTLITVRVNTMTAALLAPGLYNTHAYFTNLLTGFVSDRLITFRVGYVPPGALVSVFNQDNFNLSFQSLTFTPGNSSDYYQVCRMPATNFPTDPSGGLPIYVGGNPALAQDDVYTQVVLTNNAMVNIYGITTNAFWIGSNGEITFSQGRTDAFHPDSFVLFERTRIAALYVDLNPINDGALVSWKQMDDRVAVTWQNVGEYSVANQNDFQAELFFDGTIRLTWLHIDARGLSATPISVGVVSGDLAPADLVLQDFSRAPICGNQLALTVPAAVAEDAGVLTNQGTVFLSAPATDDLPIRLTSSDTNYLVVPAIVTISNGSSQATFDIVLPNNAVVDGPRLVYVLAALAEYSPASAGLAITEDDVPRVSIALPATVAADAGAVAGTLSLDPVPEQTVTVQLNSSWPDLASVTPTGQVVVPTGQSSAPFQVQINRGALTGVVATVTFTGSVPGWTNGMATLHIFDPAKLRLDVTLPENSLGQFSLSWPAAFGLALESSATMDTNTWSPVTNGVTLTNGLEFIFIDPVPTNQFFRLRY